jgi:hypothetical protein
MRTARRVIVAILLSACIVVLGQDQGPAASAVDRDLTLVGRDETAIPVPPPVAAAALALPALDTTPPPPRSVPPVLPSVPSTFSPSSAPDPQAVLDDALSR